MIYKTTSQLGASTELHFNLLFHTLIHWWEFSEQVPWEKAPMSQPDEIIRYKSTPLQLESILIPRTVNDI